MRAPGFGRFGELTPHSLCEQLDQTSATHAQLRKRNARGARQHRPRYSELSGRVHRAFLRNVPVSRRWRPFCHLHDVTVWPTSERLHVRRSSTWVLSSSPLLPSSIPSPNFRTNCERLRKIADVRENRFLLPQISNASCLQTLE
ncbi:PREDICTED: uncharacterized protein LOC105455242 [Wasmannia auropunctata]|uniref:uncharacterized protein LOC105455242 n=1 Tax=Wasmannia auropunctata TaxID=64793 RepID=UPI0005EEFB0D|nr:PREDICTED: uncharacterized protein LOC105455242 [Wasmannia auropunctata]